MTIALEPLNRYENHMINTLADAQACVNRSGRGISGSRPTPIT